MIAQEQSCDVLRASSGKLALKLTLCVIAQKHPCGILRVYSVKVVLKLTLRVIAQTQSCDVCRVQRDGSVDTSASLTRESVKPHSLLVRCYPRGSPTAVSLPALAVVVCNSLLSVILMNSINVDVVR